ncbi:MAG: CapA family protein [Anaerolineales bacterium]|jgi:hypothetical protein
MRSPLWRARKPIGGFSLAVLITTLSLAGCAGLISSPPQVSNPAAVPKTTQKITATPFQPELPTPTATLTATPLPSSTPEPGIWVAHYLPEAVRNRLIMPAGLDTTAERGNALLRLEVGDQNPIAKWVYALVAPFPTVADGASAKELARSWKGEARGPFSGRPLLMDEKTAAVFTALWGEPAPGAVKTLPADEMLDYAWDHQPTWAIIPFEALEPRWKTLEVDGSSPLRKDFGAENYALTVPFSAGGEPDQVKAFLAGNSETGDRGSGLPFSNREADRLTTVDMTGVTALVRATAFTMERKGITYPAEDIGGILRDADLAHISNEIPFTPDCPPPNPTQEGLRFCSKPDYIALMEATGTDIVELTGDHFADWGPEAMDYTLDLYRKEGWIYYGGGYDRQDARQARLLEHNGNRLAFIGCNAKGGGYATASDSQPGAVACDYDWMHREIARLRDEGYLVIATFQHFEYYTYSPQPDQVRDFGGMADAGAVVVSGSQAHQPQGMAFDGPRFIHYGLGNLFFDQWQYCGGNACDDGFIDRHVFYAGRYIGTELLTIRFVDYARPRLMTAAERAQLLEKVFSASGW